MTTTRTILACLFPLLVVVLLVWSASCARAQVPPMEAQMASLFEWRVVFNLTMANIQSLSVVPKQRGPVTLSFDNTNSQPLDVTVQTSTNLIHWQQETNFLAPPGPVEWLDTDVNRAQKFYRVAVRWWY